MNRPISQSVTSQHSNIFYAFAISDTENEVLLIQLLGTIFTTLHFLNYEWTQQGIVFVTRKPYRPTVIQWAIHNLRRLWPLEPYLQHFILFVT